MNTKETKKNKSSFVGGIAIFLMLTLILGGSTLFWYTQNFLSSLQTNLDQSIESIKEIESNIILFEMQLKDAREIEKNQSLEFLKVNNSNQNNAKSIQELNDQFSRFKNISETHDGDWFLLRAQYFLTIANNELSLFGRLPVIKELNNFYFFRIVPLIGNLLMPGQDMFQYLPNSSLEYPNQESLKRLMFEAGFQQVEIHDFVFGASTVHVACKPTIN